MSRISQDFLKELTETLPEKSSSSGLRYAYSLQKERLDSEGIELKYNPKRYGHFPDGREILTWEDSHYKTTINCITSMFERRFYKKGEKKPLKKYEENSFIYLSETSCLDYEVSKDDAYSCPNCGEVSKLGDIETNGCPYCDTKFNMSELYPKITNYYTVRNLGGTQQEVKQEILKSAKPVVIVTVVLALIIWLFASRNLEIIDKIIALIIYGGFSVGLGFFIGYIIWFIKMLGGGVIGAAKAAPKLKALGSKQEFTEKMKEYSDEFSFEFFTDKLISLLKTVIYSSDDKKLLYYTGPETVKFDHVIESSFTGALALRSFEVTNNICTVEVIAYMDNIYVNNGKLSKKEEKILVTIKKDLSKGINYHFDIKAINCPTCGGSFDATKENNCPFCGNSIDMLKEDWIITNIE